MPPDPAPVVSRRLALAGLGLLPFTPALAAEAADPRLIALEKRSGGRLGVLVREADQNRVLFQHRAQERFPMCSTFKLLLAAHVLARAETGQENLDRVIAYGASDLLDHAPAAREHLTEGGMKVRDLCAAAVELSDNTAANLLLAQSGGPAGLTAWLRSLGDRTTRLDRNEPGLNEAAPGDPRDTSSPAAMAATMKTLLLDSRPNGAAQALLLGWMNTASTGLARIRQGLPPGWTAGDKTGTGRRGTANDLAVITTADRRRIVAVVYLTGARLDAAGQDRIHADIGRMIAEGSAGRG